MLGVPMKWVDLEWNSNGEGNNLGPGGNTVTDAEI